MLEAAPGCVLICVIAPDFVSGRPADLLALAITLLAATRLPILPTVLVAVGSVALFRYIPAGGDLAYRRGGSALSNRRTRAG